MKNGMKKMMMVLATLGLLLGTVGCDRNRNNNGGFVGGPGFGPGFGPGGFPGGPGVTGVGFDNNGGQVQMMFQPVQNMGVIQDPFFLSGPVAINGMMNINGVQCWSGGFGGMTFAPQGQYQIFSMQPAQAQNGIVQGAQIVARGQAELLILVSWAHIQSPVGGNMMGNGFPLSATMTVQTVNGMPCNAPMFVQPGF
jgi:hypothetical protein